MCRCGCCDNKLSDAEIVWNKDLGAWEMCTSCLDAALDAAFSNGFSPDGDDVLVEPDYDDTEPVRYEYYEV